jgi:hypothetical protein
MEYLITLSSCGNPDKKPHPDAYKENYVRLDKCFCSKEDLEKLYNGKEYWNKYPEEWKKWEDEGFGHSIDDDGHIQRYFNDVGWFINIDGEKKLISFLRENKGKLEVFNGQPTITLYKNEASL